MQVAASKVLSKVFPEITVCATSLFVGPGLRSRPTLTFCYHLSQTNLADEYLRTHSIGELDFATLQAQMVSVQGVLR